MGNFRTNLVSNLVAKYIIICNITRYTSQGWNNFQLLFLNEITGNYSTPVSSVIAMSFS